MSFKLICIFYNFKAPFDFKTCIIGFGVKNRFRNISNFLNLDYFEKIKIMIIMEILIFKKKSKFKKLDMFRK